MSSPLVHDLFTVLPDEILTDTPYTMLTPSPEHPPPPNGDGKMFDSFFFGPFFFWMTTNPPLFFQESIRGAIELQFACDTL